MVLCKCGVDLNPGQTCSNCGYTVCSCNSLNPPGTTICWFCGNSIPGRAAAGAAGVPLKKPSRVTKALRKGGRVKGFPAILISALISLAAFLIAYFIFGYSTEMLFIWTGITAIVFEWFIEAKDFTGYVKAVLRTFGLIMLSLGLLIFFGDRPVFKMIPLAILAFGILTYKKVKGPWGQINDEYEQGTVLMKMALGGFLIFFFFLAFRDGFSGNNYLFWSFISLAAAFFFVIPTGVFEPSRGSRAANIVVQVQTRAEACDICTNPIQWGLITVIAFAIFALIIQATTTLLVMAIVAGGFIWLTSIMRGEVESLIFGPLIFFSLFFSVSALAGATFVSWAFIIIVSLGGLAGLPVPEARPVLGIPILFLALMVTTTAYPDIMGEAIFGQWWPMVQDTFENIADAFTPITQSFSGVFGTFQTGWSCLASPATCYQQYKPSTSVEESYKALEVTRLEPFGIAQITEKPSDKNPYSLKTNLEIKNALKQDIETGEKEPITILATIVATEPRLTTEKKEEEYPIVGNAGKIRGGVQGCDTKIDGKLAPECKCDGTWDVCKDQPFYPGYIELYTVEYEITGKDEDLTAGKYVRYGVEIEYTVDTTASLDVEVISKGEFDDLARRGELQYKDVPSKFDWGPVSIGLGVSRQQPIRDDESYPIIVSLTNDGTGKLTEIKRVVIEFPPEFSYGEGPLYLEEDGESVYQGVHYCDLNSEFQTALESQGGELEPGEDLISECWVKVELIGETIPKKTFGLTTRVSYDYLIEDDGTINVVYECDTHNQCEEDEICCLNPDGCSTPSGGTVKPGHCTTQCNDDEDCGSYICIEGDCIISFP